MYGHWTQRDTIETESYYNLYAYVRSSPFEAFDVIGLCWNNARALLHYTTNGDDIDLDETGCTGIVEEAIKSKMDEYTNIMLSEVKKTQETTLKNCYAITKKKIYGNDVVGAHSNVYWIGGIALYRQYRCTVYKHKYICKIKFWMNDEFRAPFDLDNSNSDWWDSCEVGAPFFVSHTWKRKYSNL